MHQLGKGIWEQIDDPSLVRTYNAVEILENTQKHLKAMIFPHTVEIPQVPEDGKKYISNGGVFSHTGRSHKICPGNLWGR
jgi:hypothetical protein